MYITTNNVFIISSLGWICCSHIIATARKCYGDRQSTVNMDLLYITLDYAEGSNPVANHSESHWLYGQSSDEADLCGCVLFYDLTGQFLSVSGQSCGMRQCQEGAWSFLQPCFCTKSFMLFLRTLTAIVINSVCLNFWSSDTVYGFQHTDAFHFFLRSNLDRTTFLCLLFDSDFLSWPLNW